VLTDGARGAFVGCGEAILYAPAIKTPVVGTAGAGDAFRATFSTYVARGRSVEAALRAAAINSAAVVARIDTQSGLLRGGELDQRLAATPPQPAVRRSMAPLQAAEPRFASDSCQEGDAHPEWSRMTGRPRPHQVAP
jgi:bifunctional ADP-heptose synthase (sugar kinase/adenylyltransferase)